jgi:hypothetical protein
MNNDRSDLLITNPPAERLSPAYPVDEDLAPLLATVRRLKRTLPPVQPSPDFEEELRAELLTTARAQRRAVPGPRLVVEPDTWPLPPPLDGTSPFLLLSAGLVLLTLSLALIHKLTKRQRS